jgi:hypothetical protein
VTTEAEESPLLTPVTKQRLGKADLEDEFFDIVNFLWLRVIVREVSINPIIQSRTRYLWVTILNK